MVFIRTMVNIMDSILKLESSTEMTFIKWVNKQGYDAIKVVKRGWPDRLIVLNFGYAFYIEFKREGKADRFGKRKGEKFQKHTHKDLRKRGTHVYLVDNIYQAKEIFSYELTLSDDVSKGTPPFKELEF